MESEDHVQFPSGAVRGTDSNVPRYELIPVVGIRRAAEACSYGVEVRGYPVGNWTKGIPSSNLLKHALAHVYRYIDGDRSEDHLGHAIWNLMVAAHNEERRPDMHDLEALAQVVETDFKFTPWQGHMEIVDRVLTPPGYGLCPTCGFQMLQVYPTGRVACSNDSCPGRMNSPEAANDGSLFKDVFQPEAAGVRWCQNCGIRMVDFRQPGAQEPQWTCNCNYSGPGPSSCAAAQDAPQGSSAFSKRIMTALQKAIIPFMDFHVIAEGRVRFVVGGISYRVTDSERLSDGAMVTECSEKFLRTQSSQELESRLEMAGAWDVPEEDEDPAETERLAGIARELGKIKIPKKVT